MANTQIDLDTLVTKRVELRLKEIRKAAKERAQLMIKEMRLASQEQKKQEKEKRQKELAKLQSSVKKSLVQLTN